ncbi:hypothetical protein [Sphingomonas sp. VNH70]|uniref:hypothetical protein n=1 Tax=Sphingomonas silueang TaxID=3156617 RepID=UPI0032B3CAC7
MFVPTARTTTGSDAAGAIRRAAACGTASGRPEPVKPPVATVSPGRIGATAPSSSSLNAT